MEWRTLEDCKGCCNRQSIIKKCEVYIKIKNPVFESIMSSKAGFVTLIIKLFEMQGCDYNLINSGFLSLKTV